MSFIHPRQSSHPHLPDCCARLWAWHVLALLLCCAVMGRLEVEVGATSVSLGFALGGSGPTEQSVYAFLPVRRCGLKFMLQVSCSRVTRGALSVAADACPIAHGVVIVAIVSGAAGGV
jgi:hypothetical protein